MLTHVILASGVRSCGVGSTRAATDPRIIVHQTVADIWPPKCLPETSPRRLKIVTFSKVTPGIIRAKSAMTLCMINNDTDSHEGYFSPCEPLYDK